MKLKQGKRLLTLLLALVLVLQLLPFSANKANAAGTPTITVDTKSAVIGNAVSVNVSLKNNPGITAMRINVAYDTTLLKLTNVVYNSAMGGQSVLPENYDTATSPVVLYWTDSFNDYAADGVFATLTFTVKETATSGSSCNLTVTYDAEEIYNVAEENVTFAIQNGTLSLVECVPGDINGDGSCNAKDTTRLMRYLANWDVTVNEPALDVNGDGSCNAKDTTRLMRYLSGWDVEIFCAGISATKCNHQLVATAAKAATCLQSGNIAYWQCSLCNKYYKDTNATVETTLAATVLDATGHTEVVDKGYAATYTATGLTDGSHCSVCNTVIVAQEVIPVRTDGIYNITYKYGESDLYLAGEIVNENPATYIAEQGLRLVDAELIGYTFEGWYLGTGTNATRVEALAASPTGGDITLYARWTPKSYTISFESDMVPVGDVTYTIDAGKTLSAPTLDKYTFVGWSDSDGNVVTSIPKGTTGNITLYANWASNRNKATTVSSLADPIILEDSQEGLILFTYEIGTIENVPLFTILKLNCVNGIITENSRTEETSISTTRAESIAETISKATTNSASWTLSKDWNSTTEVSESYLNQTGQTREEAETAAKSSTNTYNLSTSFGGASSNTSSSSGSYKLSGNQAHTETATEESGQNFDLSVDAKYSNETSAGVSLGIPIQGLALGVEAGTKSTFEIGGGIDYGNYVKNTNSATDSWSNGIEITGASSSSQTSSKTWNTAEGYSNSNSTSISSSVSNAVSSLISEQYGYGKSYAEGGSNSEAQELASTDSSSNEFSTAMTYYSSEIVTTTTSYSSTGNTTGDYRLVMAGTVHVFAVVGYDVADRAYFVYTYSVLDDKTEEYLDYSFDGSFNDYETSIIPFEVPSFVNDYVNNRIAMTEGLRVDQDTGIIDNYTPSAEEAASIISVPSYVAVDNGDGTYKSVKVTGITSDLFRGNTDIVGVILGRHIKDIPDNAFEGCTSLKYVIAPSITTIGSNAFAGCTSLSKFTVSSDIISVGTNAFTDAPEVYSVAANASIAQTIASCGAKSIVLDISAIPEAETANLAFTVGGVDRFELQGKDREYTNLQLVSDATTTVVNGVKIVDASRTPFHISSENLTLNRVTVKSSGYAMLLTADHTKITLNGSVSMSASSGNTVVCKDITLAPLSSSVVGKLTVAEKLLICGTIEGEEYLYCENIEYISNELYETYKKGLFNITFNATGGTASEETRSIIYGSAYGELPTAERVGYDFVGWYTEADGGTEITTTSVFTSASDITLYAHWNIEQYTASWSTGVGYTIAVNRTSSPLQGADTETLSSGDAIYYGDVLTISYAAVTGYTLSSSGETSITVTGNVTSANIYATASVNQYTASWNAGINSSIVVKRTSSPNKGAATGTLSSGDAIYYGDVLSVTYTANTGHSITKKGITSATVTRNLSSSDICCEASAKSYTYDIVYKSSNGTFLGEDEVTYKYGTTNTISPKSFSGYNTPSSQSIKWDSTSAKTITFTYTPIATATSQSLTSGWWYSAPASGTGVTYSVKAEYKNRTASSVQIRIVWTQSITRAAYQYNQYFYVSMWHETVNKGNTGSVKIASTSTWPYDGSTWHTGSVTAYSDWITVSLNTTNASTVEFACDWWTEYGSESGSWEGKGISIPAY